MIQFDDLRKDPAVQQWFMMIDPSPHTQRNYLHSLKVYCEWLNKTPSELIAEAEDDEDNIKRKIRRRINNYLLNFKGYLKERGIAPKTISLYFTSILSFYKRNNIELPNLPREGRVEGLKQNRYFLKKDEIAEALKVCDVLESAIMLTELSSGLGAEEVCELTIRQFKEGYDPKTEITTLDLRRGKTGVDFITFLTPEASRAVWEYLKFRDKKSKYNDVKRVKQLEKQYVYSDDGYLFILRNISDEYNETKDEELRKMKTKHIVNLYRKISLNSQKNKPEGTWNIIRSHNMRKFFNFTLKNAGADSFFVEYCMGHMLTGTEAAYYEGDPVKLREIYARYIPYLTIQKDLDITETPDFKRLTEENKDLKALVERLIPPWVAGISERIEERSKKMTEEERSLVKEHKSLKKMVNNLEILQKAKQEEKV